MRGKINITVLIVVMVIAIIVTVFAVISSLTELSTVWYW